MALANARRDHLCPTVCRVYKSARRCHLFSRLTESTPRLLSVNVSYQVDINASVRRMSPGERTCHSFRSKLSSPWPLPAYRQIPRSSTAPHDRDMIVQILAIGKPNPGSGCRPEDKPLDSQACRASTPSCHQTCKRVDLSTTRRDRLCRQVFFHQTSDAREELLR